MRKKIILAFDSFKGSLSSLEAARAAAEAVRSTLPEFQVEVIPVADGGEGTMKALTAGLEGFLVQSPAKGPLGSPIQARYGVCGDLVIIEIAQAAGLTLIAPEERNPWKASSFGVGELIMDAVRHGKRKFIIGLGGSATNDGGIGMLRALGFRFLDKEGCEVGYSASDLGLIAAIDMSGVSPEVSGCSFTLACDVANPLTGPEGASFVFGPQKGASPEMVKRLDEGLRSFADVTRRTLGHEFSTLPGAGAAGGLGFAFMAFLGARMRSGIDLVLDIFNFDQLLEEACLVFTGEGRLDLQTGMGKAPWGILQRAKARGVPVIALGGSIQPEAVDALEAAGFQAIFPIAAGPGTPEEAMEPNIAAQNLKRTVRQILRTIRISLPV